LLEAFGSGLLSEDDEDELLEAVLGNFPGGPRKGESSLEADAMGLYETQALANKNRTSGHRAHTHV
jgi:hypothetical protein